MVYYLRSICYPEDSSIFAAGVLKVIPMYVLTAQLSPEKLFQILSNYGMSFFLGMVGIAHIQDNTMRIAPLSNFEDLVTAAGQGPFLTIWTTEEAAKRAMIQCRTVGCEANYHLLLPHPLHDYISRVN